MYSHASVEMVYQPVVRVGSGEVWFYESLMRLVLPVGGIGEGQVLRPGEFLADIERSGELVALGLKGLQAAAAWQDAWSQKVSVNLNQSQIRAKGGLDAVLEKLYGIELTEHDLFGAEIEEWIDHVHLLGVRVMLDDTGSGWSDLEALTRLDVDVIKLDRALVMSQGKRRDMVIAGVIAMAQKMGAQVVAEGVESQYVAHAMVRLGVDGLQGWWVAKERETPLDDVESERLRRRVLML